MSHPLSHPLSHPSAFDGQTRTQSESGRPWRRLLALGVVLPLAAASVLIWSASGRESKLDKVPVAIVNDDTIVSGPTPMAAGRSLTAALTHPKKGTTNLKWVLTDSSHATRGLANGGYYAVLTIPSDFSSSILSTGTDKPVQGKLSLVSNGAASSTVPYLSQQIAAAASSALGVQVTQGYLGNVYDGFNQIASSQQKAATSAAQLANGAGQVSTGAGRLDQGASQLAGSLGKVADGSAQLADGTASVSSGAAQVAQGTQGIATGAERIHAGAIQVAASSRAVARGSAKVTAGAHAAAAGARAVSAGVRITSAGSTALATGLQQLSAACAGSGATPDFCTQLAASATAAGRLAGASSRLTGPAARVASGAATVATGAGQAARGATRSAAGATRLERSSATLAASARTLNAGAASVASGSASVDAAAGTLAGGTRQAATAGGSVAAGSKSVADGASQTSAGAQQLSSGLTKGAKQSPTYSTDQQKALKAVVSQPVALTSSIQHTTHGNGWLIALILAAVLWLAALVAALSRDLSDVVRQALAPVSSRRLAWAQAVPVLGLAALQVVAVLLTLLLFHPSAAALAPLCVLTLLAGLVFALLALMLRLAAGRIGITLFVLLLVLQLAASGNVIPLQTSPATLRALNGVLPLTAYVNGASQLVSGGHVASYAGVLVVLLLWAGLSAMLLVTVVRRRRVIRPSPQPRAAPAT